MSIVYLPVSVRGAYSAAMCWLARAQITSGVAGISTLRITPASDSASTIALITAGMAPTNPIRLHLADAAPYMRPLLMGVILLVVLRFAPRGLIPERSAMAARK